MIDQPTKKANRWRKNWALWFFTYRKHAETNPVIAK